MNFEINQIFEDIYPPEAAIWCNENNARIVELENENATRVFQIQKMPSPSLDEIKLYKINELKTIRNNLEESPVEYKEKLWDFDLKSRDRINAAATALEINNLESITWTSFDDTSLELTAKDLKMIISSAAIRGDMLHKQYRALRDAVNNATSIEEINSINWE